MVSSGSKRCMAEAPRGGEGAKVARAGSPGSTRAKKATHFKTVASKPVALSAEDKKTRTKGWQVLVDALSVGSSGGHHLVVADQVERSVFTKVLSGAILPLDLAAMSSAEMASEELKQKRDAAAEASKFDVLQTEEFLQLQKQAGGAQLLKAQGLIDPKKEEDEEERREREAREREEREEAGSIVSVGEEDEATYLKNVKWHPTYDDDVHAGSDVEGSDGDDPNRRSSSPTLDDVHAGSGGEEGYLRNYTFLEPLTDDENTGEDDDDHEMEFASSPTLDLKIGAESSDAEMGPSKLPGHNERSDAAPSLVFCCLLL
ncbi:hypothetical protein T484DRAFT_1823286 [Baffinella frigidus]|nr:hypothetical protein T484DRAFT_1823286 [Cryptophyta sp. CCMP2293]